MDRKQTTVYLDNNATTMVAPEVRDVMTPFLCELYGNPSSMHAFGGQVAKFVARAREEVARFVNCSPEEIVFTSCATESDNTAIRGAVEALGEGTKIITTAVEHPAVLQPCRRLKAQGFEEVELPVDSVGQIDLGRLEDEVKSAVDEGKAELAKFESMIKDKESEYDSVASDIGKKVLASIDEGKSFDISSINDLIEKAKGIKSCIDEITSKINAFKS